MGNLWRIPRNNRAILTQMMGYTNYSELANALYWPAGSTGGGSTGLYLNLSDIATLSESKAFYLQLLKSDSVIPSQVIAKYQTKVFQDSIATSDVFSYVKLLTINNADTITATISMLKYSQMNKTDSLSLSDLKIAGFSKIYSDSMAASDSTIKKAYVNKTDGITSQDAFLKSIRLNKNDSISCIIAASKSVGLNKSEISNIADAIVKNISITASERCVIDTAFSKCMSILSGDSLTLLDNIDFGPDSGNELFLELFDGVDLSDYATIETIAENFVEIVALIYKQIDLISGINPEYEFYKSIMPVDIVTDSEIIDSHINKSIDIKSTACLEIILKVRIWQRYM